MNEWNRLQMALDPDGFVESCDKCNTLIHNLHWMGMSFVSEDGKQILCFQCWDATRREKLIVNNSFDNSFDFSDNAPW